MGEKERFYLIGISGLFHDIGKFYQRSGVSIEDYKDDFKYQHAALSLKAINEELSEGLKAVFSQQEMEVIKDGTYHHNPKNQTQEIFQKADWFSSSERLDEAPFDTSQDIGKFMRDNPRLRAVFENICLEKNKDKDDKRYFYKIDKLSLNKDTIFPQDYYQLYTDYQLKKESIKTAGDYKSHWDNFKKEFNEKLTYLASLGVKFQSHPDKIFETIYYLIYKYNWCIPASTFDSKNKNNHYPDISLFDHSRVLSAVAVILADYFKDRQINKEESILHIKADISGIQKFIYTVYKKPVAKTLRGRSFFIALLPEVFSRYIISNLNYPITNILYSGGGVFELIVANTQQNREKIKKLLTDIEEYLLGEFEGELGLSVGTYSYTPDKLSSGKYREVLQKLNESLDNGKRRKFINTLDKAISIVNQKHIQTKKLCPVCRTYLTEEDKENCDNCEIFIKIGEKLPSTKYLIFSKSVGLNFLDSRRLITLGNLGVVYLAESSDEHFLKDESITSILKINDTDNLKNATGFKFLGITVPKAKEDFASTEEVVSKGQIIPFEEIAKFSQGDERIGILRMDVDNLGKIFSQGLGDKITISRIATLSRMFDLFFTGYINKLCIEESKDKGQNKTDSIYYILYSGGDDLFIVGPWDFLLDFANRIYKEFTLYTTANPDITISAGYVQIKPKFPIRISAEMAGKAEEASKESGKNRITAFKNTVEWKDFEEVIKKATKLTSFIENKRISRGFIHYYKTLEDKYLVEKNTDKKIIYKQKPNPMIYPYIQYYIARNVSNDEAKKFLEEEYIKNLEKNKDVSDFILNYSFLKTRKVRGEKDE
ncbi:type III-A CRISPR-associated protein Cas10/Csm1 [Sulfurihydrogenibium sp.]|uniref:type III-A CRISPR-associated protein Cas10/Csm1 n=1 Tax=Sulfurihydrogenibium sp. TaxID=2053621 RepID=UPI00262C6D42|nr:type III-A CRISPR-associated protein Cas10/Csm1 [Sulfurihydrogenibium sp.]